MPDKDICEVPGVFIGGFEAIDVVVSYKPTIEI
jgi:hypothetical protein